MKNKMLILFFCINSISIYSQDINRLIVELNLPKEYEFNLKYYTFLELFEKSIRYKEMGREEEFKFNGFSNQKTQECQFTEVQNDGKGSTVIYHFENQKLKEKEISINSVNGRKYSTICFYKNGKLKSIEDYYRLKDKYFFDKKGNISIKNIQKKSEQKDKEVIKSFFGYELPVISRKKIEITFEKLIEIKKNISVIAKDRNFDKDFEEFTLEDWIIYNQIKNYLKKELKLKILKNKDIYFYGMDEEILYLLDEVGTKYMINENFDNGKSNRSLSIYIQDADEKFCTMISYYSNRNIKSVCQKEIKRMNEKLLGMNANYKENGEVIREVNLEEAFKLTKDSLYSIVRNSKICTYRKDFYLEFNRYLNTNYGKIWAINIRCYGEPIPIFINDSTSEIYTGALEFYSSEQYIIKYGEQDYEELEKKLGKKIFIYNRLNCQ
jgi:hypothetical protein